jgi:hypothetical protein
MLFEPTDCSAIEDFTISGLPYALFLKWREA